MRANPGSMKSGRPNRRKIPFGAAITAFALVLLGLLGTRIASLDRSAQGNLASLHRERLALAYDQRLRALLTAISRNAGHAAIAREVAAVHAMTLANEKTLRSMPQWRAARAAWMAGDDAAAGRALESLWLRVEETSGLQYDRNAQTRHFADILFSKLPGAIDESTQAAASSGRAFARRRIAVSERVSLAYLVNYAVEDFDLNADAYGTIGDRRAIAHGRAYAAAGRRLRTYVVGHVLEAATPRGDPLVVHRDAADAVNAAGLVGLDLDRFLDRQLAARQATLYERNRDFYRLIVVLALLFTGIALLLSERSARRAQLALTHAETEAQRLSSELAMRNAERALQLSQAQFQAIFERAALGIAVLGPDGAIRNANAAFSSMFGATSEALLAEHRPEFDELFRGERDLIEFEQQVLTLSGHDAWVDCMVSLVRDDGGSPYVAICMFTDVTDVKNSQRRILHEITHGALTGLPNRILFESRLREQLAALHLSPQAAFAVVLIDLDRFREINEGLGHDAADFVVSQVAQRLRKAARPEDVVAHLGGDEFAILIRSLSEVLHIEVTARRLLTALAEPLTLAGRTIFISASLGVAIGSAAYQRAEDVVHDTQVAMRYSKAAGGSRFSVFDSKMHARAEKRLELAGDLRLALDRNELHLLYQPIVGLDAGNVIGCEALLRWNHPREGLMTPNDFMPLAEQVGLAAPIGRFVISTACAQLAAWHRIPGAAHFPMNVNISAADLLDPDFEQTILAGTREYGIAPADVTLEITESVVLDAGSRPKLLVERLRSRGFCICIDDFGTGYSSLRYLQQFKIDILKIDRSFISGPDGEVASEPIVRTLMTLADAFGVRVVAEGIETKRQRDMLRSANCLYGQGYYFARALSAKEFAAKYPAVFGSAARSA